MQDPKKSPKIAIWAPSHNFLGYIFGTKACIDNRKKNLLSSNISSTCPHKFGAPRPISTDFASWKRYCTTLVVGVSQTAAFNRGRHLYSTGRPSRWAFSHILVVFIIPFLIVVICFHCGNFALECYILQLHCCLLVQFCCKISTLGSRSKVPSSKISK